VICCPTTNSKDGLSGNHVLISTSAAAKPAATNKASEFGVHIANKEIYQGVSDIPKPRKRQTESAFEDKAISVGRDLPSTVAQLAIL